MICPACGAANRVPADRLDAAPACGKCKTALFTGEPHGVGLAGFERHVRKGSLPVLVDFWADWCAPCKQLSPIVESVASEVAGKVKVIKIDVDNNGVIDVRDVAAISKLMASGTTFTGTVTIPAGQTLTIVLLAVASANGAPVNYATVSAPASASDTNLGNNTGSAALVIGPSADLVATKAASTPSLVIGGTTDFTLTFVNNGPSAVTGARITDTLPSGMGTLTFVSASVAASEARVSSSFASASSRVLRA